MTRTAQPEPAGAPDAGPRTGEQQLLQRLRQGDEAAFLELVGQHHGLLLRLARLYVRDPAVAEEVVQETWLGVLAGVRRFEGRSSLKTWICRILMNQARTRGQREARSLPFSAVADPEADADEPAVDPARFHPAGHAFAGHWQQRPRDWAELPEARFLSQELQAQLRQAVDRLPPQQRQVIALRDLEGWSSTEVCNFLGISETNQRVLLHRARSRVRRALEQYLDEAEHPAA